MAERNREGSIGEANAVRDQRISVAAANATAVDGENKMCIRDRHQYCSKHKGRRLPALMATPNRYSALLAVSLTS